MNANNYQQHQEGEAAGKLSATYTTSLSPRSSSAPFTLPVLLRYKTLPQMWRSKLSIFIAFLMPILVSSLCVSIFAPIKPSESDFPVYNATSMFGENVLIVEHTQEGGDPNHAKKKEYRVETPRIFYVLDETNDKNHLLNASLFQLFGRIYGNSQETMLQNIKRFDNNSAMFKGIFRAGNALNPMCDITISLNISTSNAINYEIQTSSLNDALSLTGHGGNNLPAFNPVATIFDADVAKKGTATLQLWLLQALAENFANTTVTFYNSPPPSNNNSNGNINENYYFLENNSNNNSSNVTTTTMAPNTQNLLLPNIAFYPQPSRTEQETNLYALRLTREFGAVRLVVPIFATLGFLGAMTVSVFVEDKESGIRAMFAVTGASPASYIFSILIENLIVRGASSATLLGIFFPIGIFDNSNFFFVWVMYLLCICALAMFGYAFSALFSSSRFSNFFSFIVFAFCVGVGSLLSQCEVKTTELQRSCSEQSKAAASFFLPPVSFLLTIDALMRMENIGTGSSFSNMFDSPIDLTGTLTATPSLGTTLILLICSSVFYYIIGSYLELVIPNEKMGIALSWYFPLEGWLINRRSGANSSLGNEIEEPISSSSAAENNNNNNNNSTSYSPPGRPLLFINKLRKEFGDFVAVDFGDSSLRELMNQNNNDNKGVDPRFYENEIIVYSGSNGSGKTTSISMLMSLLQPTSGDATYWFPSDPSNRNSPLSPYSLRKNPDVVRHNVSYCPQFSSALVPKLTVREHFHLFAALRGVGEVDKRIAEFAQILEFGPKLDCQAKALSGGMMRQMMTALAFLDDSRVVFLDEPTTGVAPESRRKIWALIEQERLRMPRLIFLTTHYCDEAEVLASRIAMLKSGQLLGIGTPMQISRDLGAGYTLRFFGVGGGKKDNGQHQKIVDFVRTIASSAVPNRAAGSELVLNIPFSEPNVVQLLRALEADEKLKDSFQFEQTTFEEAFLSLEDKLTKLSETAGDSNSRPTVNATDLGAAVTSEQQNINDTVYGATTTSPVVSSPQEQERILVPQHHSSPLLRIKGSRNWLTRYFWEFLAVIYMRSFVMLRDYTALLFQVVFPVSFLIAGMIIYSTGKPGTSADGVQVKPWMVFDSSSSWLAPYSLAGFSSTGLEVVGTNNDSLNEIRSIAANTTSIYPTKCCYNYVLPQYVNNYSTESSATWEINYWRNNNDNNNNINLSMNFFLNPRRKTALLQTVHDFFQGVSNNDHGKQGSTSATPTIHGAFRPLPISSLVAQASSQLILAMFIALSYSFVPASYAAFVVRMRSESETKSASLQIASGASNLMLWIGGYIFDTVMTLIFSGLVMAVLSLGLKDSEPIFLEHLDLLWLGVVIYILSTTMLSYFLSAYIERFARAQLTLALLYFATVVVLMISWMSAGLSTGLSKTPARIITIVFVSISPLFAYVMLVLNLLNTFGCRSGAEVYCSNNGYANGITDFCVTGYIIQIMYYQLGAYSGLLLLQQLPYARWKNWLKMCCCNPGDSASTGINWKLGLKNPDAEEDDDVKRERENVEKLLAGQMINNNNSDDSGDQQLQQQDNNNNNKDTVSSNILVSNMKKRYDDGTIALRGVSFEFGTSGVYTLVGPNSAGKSSTVKILMGELPTAGSAYYRWVPGRKSGISLFDRSGIQDLGVGYCPQHDLLLPEMTVAETLRHYALLKGLAWNKSGASISEIIDAFLEHSTLAPYRDRPSGKLSGGNRRKLSLCVALLGDPEIVFGDEIAAGVDVVSKRQLWRMISEFPGTFVLVSHSMEEVAALCNRKAMILVQGQIRAVGSVPALRKKFGAGFSLELQCKLEEATAVASFVNEKFPGCKRLEEHLLAPSRQKWWLPAKGKKNSAGSSSSPVLLSSIFETLQSNSSLANSFSVSQTSLEKVYLQLVADQERTDETLPDEEEVEEDVNATTTATTTSRPVLNAADTDIPVAPPSLPTGYSAIPMVEKENAIVDGGSNEISSPANGGEENV